jgi:hypothetical protein
MLHQVTPTPHNTANEKLVKEMNRAESNGHSPDVIPAPGWAAVYVREGKEFVWPLVAWLQLAPNSGALMVGLALSFDGRAVVRADQIEGFKCYLPPAEWLADPPEALPVPRKA